MSLDSGQTSLFGSDGAVEERKTRLVGPPEVFRHPIAALHTRSAEGSVNWTIRNRSFTYVCRQTPSPIGYATVYDLEVFLIGLTAMHQRGLLPAKGSGHSESSLSMDLSVFLALMDRSATSQTVLELTRSLARLRGTTLEYVRTNNSTSKVERIYVGGWLSEAVIDVDQETDRRTIQMTFSSWSLEALHQGRLFFIDRRLLSIEKPAPRRVAMMLASRSLEAGKVYSLEFLAGLIYPGLTTAKAKYALKQMAAAGPIWGHELVYDGESFVFRSIESVTDLDHNDPSSVDGDTSQQPPARPRAPKRLARARADIDPFTAAAMGILPPKRALKRRRTPAR